jgi:methionine--tRNA ligase beta chain
MSNINFNDFQKLDIRVGTVTEAETPKWSHWVVKLTVDLGKEVGERTIFAGVLGFYEPKDLKGKQFPFIVNLEPKKIGPKGDYSEGMLLAAVMPLEKPVKVMDSETDEKPVLLELTEKVPNGTKIS